MAPNRVSIYEAPVDIERSKSESPELVLSSESSYSSLVSQDLLRLECQAHMQSAGSQDELAIEA